MSRQSPRASTPLPLLASQQSPSEEDTRLQEKAELRTFNDRMAAYIDHVRELETQNARLNIEYESARDEITNIKTVYEDELSAVRQSLNVNSLEKTRLEVIISRALEANSALSADIEKKEKDLKAGEDKIIIAESRADGLERKLAKVRNNNKEQQQKIEILEKELYEKIKNLEVETLARVDLENSMQSLHEQLSFKEHLHAQEMKNARSAQIDFYETDGHSRYEYEAKLQQSLQKLREDYEKQLQANRVENERCYESKIKSLQAALKRNVLSARSIYEELHALLIRNEGLNVQICELEENNATHNKRIHKLETYLNSERSRYNTKIADLNEDLQRMRDEASELLKDYQSLLNRKASLDLDVAAYDKLLYGEEERLCITHERSSSSLKRKHNVFDGADDTDAEIFVVGNAAGDMQISEVDVEGKYVKINNKGCQDIALGGWQLVRYVEGNDVVYKFASDLSIEAGATITIWSADSSAEHEPSDNIVMESQNWIVSENMKTVIINADGNEVANSKCYRREVARNLSRKRTNISAGTLGSAGVSGESSKKKGDGRCLLM